MKKNIDFGRVSLWNVFRLIFVVFSLYLLQDAFFRWDGVRYYASFSKFLPAIALVSILWSMTAIFVSILIWLLIRGAARLSRGTRWSLSEENLLLLAFVFISVLIIGWVVKLSLLGGGSSLQIKLLILACIIVSSILFTWKFQGRIDVIQEGLTPLVWLFGIIVILAMPLVVYQTWIKGDAETRPGQSLQSHAAGKDRPNIILVTFDALTARDMSVYGYHRPTTPFITEWAKEATLFTRAEAVDNYTYPTTLSLMTGQRPWTHLQYNPNGRKFSTTTENLAKALKGNGYYNIAVSHNILAGVERLGISADFDIAPSTSEFSRPGSFLGEINEFLYDLFGDRILFYDWITKWDFLFNLAASKISRDIHVTRYPPEKAFSWLLSILDNKVPEPYFVWIHLLPPHDPYLPPEPFMGMFDSSSGLRTQKGQFKFTRSPDASYTKVEQATLDALRARYDEFIRYSDKQFEYFIEQLRKREGWKNTALILSSDHGESFEHDYITHGGNDLYEQVTHIPLIIKGPGQAKGVVIDDLVEQIDITATILDLAGITIPSWMEGRSLLPFMHAERLSPRPVFSMSLYRNPRSRNKISKGTVAVREGDYKLIHNLDRAESLLFNLREDPRELNNLIEIEPVTGRRLLAIIKGKLKEANEKIMESK